LAYSRKSWQKNKKLKIWISIIYFLTLRERSIRKVKKCNIYIYLEGVFEKKIVVSKGAKCLVPFSFKLFSKGEEEKNSFTKCARRVLKKKLKDYTRLLSKIA